MKKVELSSTSLIEAAFPLGDRSKEKEEPATISDLLILRLLELLKIISNFSIMSNVGFLLEAEGS